MLDAILLVLASLCTVIGMAWFALAKEPHWQQVRGSETLTPARQHVLRTLGSTSIGTSLIICLIADHPTMAALVWIMLLAAGALIVAFTLSWRARWLKFSVAWLQS